MARPAKKLPPSKIPVTTKVRGVSQVGGKPKAKSIGIAPYTVREQSRIPVPKSSIQAQPQRDTKPVVLQAQKAPIPKTAKPVKAVRTPAQNIAPMRLESRKSIIKSANRSQFTPVQETEDQKRHREAAEARKGVVRKSNKRSEMMAKDVRTWANDPKVKVKDTWIEYHQKDVKNIAPMYFDKKWGQKKNAPESTTDRIFPKQATPEDPLKATAYQKRILVEEQRARAREVATENVAARTAAAKRSRERGTEVFQGFDQRDDKTLRGLAEMIVALHKADPFKKAHPRLVSELESLLRRDPSARQLMEGIGRVARAEFGSSLPVPFGTEHTKTQQRYITDVCDAARKHYPSAAQEATAKPKTNDTRTRSKRT